VVSCFFVVAERNVCMRYDISERCYNSEQGGVLMNLHDELKAAIDSVLDHLEKQRKENEQLWAQLEAAEARNAELEAQIKDLQETLQSDRSKLENAIARIRETLDSEMRSIEGE